MNKRPLVPSFLQKLDDRLLRNKPAAWSARTHLVLWFSALFAIVLTVFCYMVFFDAKQYSSMSGWVTFVGLIAFMGFVLWLIFLLRFNVFKRYGNWFAWDGLKSFLLYFVSIGVMVAVCFIPSAVQTYRANQQFGNDEIVNDINEINIDACKLEHELLPLAWKPDTCKLIDRKTITVVKGDMQMDSVVAEAVETTYVNHDSYHLVDSSELSTKLFQTDSVVKIHDSLYVFFECPNYRFVSAYDADEYTTKKILRPAEIYRTILRPFQKPDRAALLNKMDAFKTKYASDNYYSSYYDVDETYDPHDNYESKIKKKYSLSRINNGIDNAVRKKYTWIKGWRSYLRIFYYITLALTLLVFIFRHSTVKTFFLSLLAAVLLVIFTGLMMVGNYNNTETALYSFMIVYYVIFAIVACTIFNIKVRRAIQGIALNLFLFMTPFIPLIFVALNNAMRYSYDSYQTNQLVIVKGAYTYDYSLYIVIAEIAGGIILLILLEPFFRKLYRKWYAAAED